MHLILCSLCTLFFSELSELRNKRELISLTALLSSPVSEDEVKMTGKSSRGEVIHHLNRHNIVGDLSDFLDG